MAFCVRIIALLLLLVSWRALVHGVIAVEKEMDGILWALLRAAVGGRGHINPEECVCGHRRGSCVHRLYYFHVITRVVKVEQVGYFHGVS